MAVQEMQAEFVIGDRVRWEVKGIQFTGEVIGYWKQEPILFPNAVIVAVDGDDEAALVVDGYLI